MACRNISRPIGNVSYVKKQEIVLFADGRGYHKLLQRNCTIVLRFSAQTPIKLWIPKWYALKRVTSKSFIKSSKSCFWLVNILKPTCNASEYLPATKNWRIVADEDTLLLLALPLVVVSLTRWCNSDKISMSMSIHRVATESNKRRWELKTLIKLPAAYWRDRWIANLQSIRRAKHSRLAFPF